MSQHHTEREMIQCHSLLRRRAIRLFLFIILLFVTLVLVVPAPLDLKKTATDFSKTASPVNWSSPRILPERGTRSWTGPLKVDIDERYLFARELGSGREGTVRLYNDTRTGRAVAIKTFHSQPRNRLPERLTGAIQGLLLTTWPAEIPATLLLGNSRLETHDEQLFSRHRLSTNRLDIVPALDYFTIASQGKRWKQSEWQLVLPYLGPDIEDSKGTLSDFALYLKTEQKTTAQLDTALRPGLHRVLGTLGRMHVENLCHNDIKSDNLYVQEKGNWLVGDLGNVREISHPYYQTNQWALEGQWSDCVQNDVRRTIIAYLATIRRAAADRMAFDDQFFCGETFLSRLYWEYIRSPVSAQELHSRLEQNLTGIMGFELPHCSKNEPTTMMIDLMHLQRLLLTRSVDKELRWSTPPSRWRVWVSNWV